MSYTSPSDQKYYKQQFGHFKTNFSIDKKEANESTEYDMQQTFHRISFETQFDTINQNETFLHNIETVLIPSASHEIHYYTNGDVEETSFGSGQWQNQTASGYKFGDNRYSSTAGSYCEFEFSGVSCFVALTTHSGTQWCKTELSSDGGTTWKYKKIFSSKSNSSENNQIFELYSGLTYDDYKVRLIIGDDSSDNISIDYFGYTTYMCQKSISQYYYQTSATKLITDVPPTTTLLTGSHSAVNQSDTNSWNRVRSYITNPGGTETIEFKFYGSKIWINASWTSSANIDMSLLIDGVTTYNKINSISSNKINTNASQNIQPVFIRLDNGNLSEGWHIVKLTYGTGSGQSFSISGWGWYSSSAESTVCRSLICGKDSYAIGCDNSNFTFSGSWTSTDISADFLRRRKYTSTQNDYVEITTPNNSNLKAIYLIATTSNSTAGSEVQATLSSGLTKYILTTSNNYELSGNIFLIYDKNLDGDLHNKTLRFTKNISDSNIFYFNGIIFEIGDNVENDAIFCMPKWSTYESPLPNYRTLISSSHRIDVYGEKTDSRPGRKPMVFSPIYDQSAGSNCYWRHGLGWIGYESLAHSYMMDTQVRNNFNGNNGTDRHDFNWSKVHSSNHDPAVINQNANGEDYRIKFVLELIRVI